MTKVIETSNENETMAAGEGLATEILNLESDKSVVVFLEGELGAGKTTFTKGMLKGFDYNELVKSPTYNLVEIHQTKTHRIFHFDLYRINDVEELDSLGLEIYLDSGSYCFLEWPELAQSFLPKNYHNIKLIIQQNNRKIAFIK